MRNSQNLMDAVVRTLRVIEGAAVKVGYCLYVRTSIFHSFRFASVKAKISPNIWSCHANISMFIDCYL